MSLDCEIMLCAPLHWSQIEWARGISNKITMFCFAHLTFIAIAVKYNVQIIIYIILYISSVFPLVICAHRLRNCHFAIEFKWNVIILALSVSFSLFCFPLARSYVVYKFHLFEQNEWRQQRKRSETTIYLNIGTNFVQLN